MESKLQLSDIYDNATDTIKTMCSPHRKNSLSEKSVSYNNLLFSENDSVMTTLHTEHNTYIREPHSSKDNFVIIPLEIECTPLSILNKNESVRIFPLENMQTNDSSPYQDSFWFVVRMKCSITYGTMIQFVYKTSYCIWGIPCRISHYLGKHKIQTLNHFLSIFLHICLMIIFEIYFYFNYVVVIEKQVFLEKITVYFNDLSHYNHDKYSPFALSFVNNASHTDHLLDDLYIASQESLLAQRHLLESLLYAACKIAAAFSIVFCILFVIGVLHCKNIKWKWIIAENIMMLVLLGCFEYLFFTTIIMNYNPISDAELEYLVFRNVVNYVKSNDTDHMDYYVPTIYPSSMTKVIYDGLS